MVYKCLVDAKLSPMVTQNSDVAGEKCNVCDVKLCGRQNVRPPDVILL